jgi:IS30 family transposase
MGKPGSTGRLPHARVQECVELLRRGLNPRQVAARTGVSKSTLYVLHRSLGGVYAPIEVVYSPRYLSREERYEIARLIEAGLSVRAVARQMRRAPSTISRELARFRREVPELAYQPERAHTHAWQRQRRPKASKLGANPLLRARVQQMLDQPERLSPEQVAGRLRREHPDDESMQISHESIYRSIYLYPRGELARELKATLRTRRTVRKPRGRREERGRIKDAVSIHDRPPEVAGRLIPGHHEGDLIKGSTASNSAVGTIVERHTGYLSLLHLPDGWAAEHVAAAVTSQITALPEWFVKTLTWDRGIEMSQHAKITATTGVQVYFADPYSPQQRPSNENTNGLIREYLPKGTDLSVHTAEDLTDIARLLNNRPRKRLAYATPQEAYDDLLTQHLTGVATTH